MRFAPAILLVLMLAAPAGALTFSEGDFANITVEAVGDDSVDTNVFPSGGVGDSPFLRIQTVLGPPTNDIAAGVLLGGGAVWDTGVRGPIGTIDLTLLARSFSASGQGQGVGVFLRDGGGALYRGGSTLTFVPVGFQLLSVSALTETDFTQVDDGHPSGMTPAVRPDFSSGVFELGFYARNTGSIGTTLDYDDVQITVTAVPEPALGLLLLAAGLALRAGA